MSKGDNRKICNKYCDERPETETEREVKIFMQETKSSSA
jgi:hypothetical protein